MLAIGDMKGMNETEIKDHISGSYGGDKSGFDYGSPTQSDVENLAKELESFEILIAYESVGSYGCDSSSFFLFRGADGTLYENHGAHCSCYGFEGQFSPEETSIDALLHRSSIFSTGGYDDDGNSNLSEARKFVELLK